MFFRSHTRVKTVAVLNILVHFKWYQHIVNEVSRNKYLVWRRKKQQQTIAKIWCSRESVTQFWAAMRIAAFLCLNYLLHAIQIRIRIQLILLKSVCTMHRIIAKNRLLHSKFGCANKCSQPLLNINRWIELARKKNCPLYLNTIDLFLRFRSCVFFTLVPFTLFPSFICIFHTLFKLCPKYGQKHYANKCANTIRTANLAVFLISILISIQL